MVGPTRLPWRKLYCMVSVGTLHLVNSQFYQTSLLYTQLFIVGPKPYGTPLHPYLVLVFHRTVKLESPEDFRTILFPVQVLRVIIKV